MDFDLYDKITNKQNNSMLPDVIFQKKIKSPKMMKMTFFIQ